MSPCSDLRKNKVIIPISVSPVLLASFDITGKILSCLFLSIPRSVLVCSFVVFSFVLCYQFNAVIRLRLFRRKSSRCCISCPVVSFDPSICLLYIIVILQISVLSFSEYYRRTVSENLGCIDSFFSSGKHQPR